MVLVNNPSNLFLLFYSLCESSPSSSLVHLFLIDLQKRLFSFYEKFKFLVQLSEMLRVAILGRSNCFNKSC